ncbi:hypothetical protein QCA50_009053 [Cerrena zonata]|uniref:Uncharacterized protein n=1 Tax=Cerrena zonata TaxID=2478898 RepID=A0AAW0GCH7_9APHY
MWESRVRPQTLSLEKGNEVAHDCKKILVTSDINDVDVEIRESLVTPLSGPRLLSPIVFHSNPTADLRNLLTPTLGLPIAHKSTPSIEGTGGFFVKCGDSKKLFLVTACHVVFNPKTDGNNTFKHQTSAPRQDVLILGDSRFKLLLTHIEKKIELLSDCISVHEKRIKLFENIATEEAIEECTINRNELARVEKAMGTLQTFHDDISKRWTNKDMRVLGHVIYSPPIEFDVGAEQCTQDFAIIEINPSKIDDTNFKGNVIDLGTTISPGVFTRMMYSSNPSAHSFSYPDDCLLKLDGTIPLYDMQHPPDLDQHGEPCLTVIMHGGATGLSVGRANWWREFRRS